MRRRLPSADPVPSVSSQIELTVADLSKTDTADAFSFNLRVLRLLYDGDVGLQTIKSNDLSPRRLVRQSFTLAFKTTGGDELTPITGNE